MKAQKEFDAVALKNAIQRKLLARHRNMTAAELRADIHRRLQVSRSPLAEMWRRLRAGRAPTRPIATAAR